METRTKYNCLIVDDEALARQLIQLHLNQISSLELAGTCSSAIEAMRFLETNSVDILFLDIQMPKLSGIDFLKSLQNPPKVIFTTAYSDFALEGYELNVIDYLLKPITFERFQKATNKCIEILNLERETKEKTSVQLEEKSILIKSSHQLIKIKIADILFIEGLHKYIKIVTKTKNYTTLFSLNSMEKELSDYQFYRCHRSFIVNLSNVERVEGNQVFFGTHSAAISKLNKLELISKLGKQIG